MKDFIKQAAHVKPNANQLRMLTETPFYAFVHFGPNTSTGLEWGNGTEDPCVFNPCELDCDSWCEAFKSAGMTGVVLTAKHHDGFCLWQSKYTEHCMKNSPYKDGKGDVVRELSEACRRHGLKFGFYLSPWDRNSKLYGTPEYNVYYKNQLTELLTGYGDIFYVWFDGACGEGPNGKKQEYDFDGYFELIEKYQPNAAIFNDRGNIRWCGNEAGDTRYAEWSVVPSELCPYCEIQTKPGPFAGELSYMYNTNENIGALSNIMYSKGLVFAPSEVDMSIRPGWFYHPEEEPHSLDRLFDTYIRTVGGNTTFNLNVPPMPNGKLDARDIERLSQLGSKIKQSFGHNLAEGKEVTHSPCGESDTQQIIDIDLKEKTKVNYLVLCENIAQGQRVENFFVQKLNEYGLWDNAFEGTTIGFKRIIPLNGTETEKLRVFIVSSRDTPDISDISVY